jgi:hypothetical protein
MPTFSPPTREEPFLPEEGRGGSVGILRRITFPVGYSVVITDSVPSTYPGTIHVPATLIDGADPGSGLDDKAVFLGGHVYMVTAAEAALLDSAGYTTT